MDEIQIKELIREKDTNYDLTMLELTQKITDSRSNIFGLILFIVVFVILVPWLIIRSGRFELLIPYFPNVDMIATAISYNGGPEIFGSFKNIWLYLYDSRTMQGYISQMLINYFALIGASGVIAYKSHIYNDWKRGWSLGFIMMIMTYLAPNDLINKIQEKCEEYLKDYELSNNDRYLIIMLLGMITVVLIILLESYIIEGHHLNITKIIKGFV
mgnify:CR=1 FL=1|tara:strand:- start:120 stop:761 length:642 start_codon:yes stop_codon:yes gene_type:complete